MLGNPGDKKVDPVEQGEEEVAPLSPEGEALTQALYAELGEGGTDNLAHAFINSIGEADEHSGLERFAQGRGYTREETVNAVNNVGMEYQKQAVEYVSKKTGEDGQAILDWAVSQFNAESFQEVARLHFFGQGQQKYRGYDAIINEYQRHKMREAR